MVTIVKSLVRRMVFVLLIVGSLVWSAGIVESQTPTPIPSKWSHIVVAIDGTAEISREMWNSTMYSPLETGMPILITDLISTHGNSTVTVACAHGEIIPIYGTGVTAKCQTLGNITAIDMIASGVRAGGNPLEAKLLTPLGKIIQPTPDFDWFSVANATQYLVKVEHVASKWEIVSGTPHLDYPATWDPLLPGTHRITIEPINYAGNKITGRTVTELTVADVAEQASFQERINSLDAVIARADFKQLVKVTQYVDAHYYSEAITLMEQMLKLNIRVSNSAGMLPTTSTDAFLNSPYLYYLLGSLYEKQELYDQAVNAYRIAHKLAKKSNYSDSLARTSEKLGFLDITLDEEDERLRYCLLQNALTYYADMGEIDPKKTENIKKEMAHIAKNLILTNCS